MPASSGRRSDFFKSRVFSGFENHFHVKNFFVCLFPGAVIFALTCILIVAPSFPIRLKFPHVLLNYIFHLTLSLSASSPLPRLCVHRFMWCVWFKATGYMFCHVKELYGEGGLHLETPSAHAAFQRLF